MWLTTESGEFYSVCTDRDNSSVRHVRSWDERSAAKAAKFVGRSVLHMPEADYPYRVMMSDGEFARFLEQFVKDMRAPKFKPSVTAAVGHSSPIVDAVYATWDVFWRDSFRNGSRTRRKGSKKVPR